MDDFREISARFKKSHDAEDESTEPQVFDHAESYRIRAKMIGVLLMDARVKAGRSLEDCARTLRTSPEQLERWEFGEEAPSLPQLELLAFYLGVPVSHFWGMDTLEATADDYASAQDEFLSLR